MTMRVPGPASRFLSAGCLRVKRQVTSSVHTTRRHYASAAAAAAAGPGDADGTSSCIIDRITRVYGNPADVADSSTVLRVWPGPPMSPSSNVRKIGTFTKILAADPNCILALVGQAHSLMHAGDVDAALMSVEAALDRPDLQSNTALHELSIATKIRCLQKRLLDARRLEKVSGSGSSQQVLVQEILEQIQQLVSMSQKNTPRQSALWDLHLAKGEFLASLNNKEQAKEAKEELLTAVELLQEEKIHRQTCGETLVRRDIDIAFYRCYLETLMVDQSANIHAKYFSNDAVRAIFENSKVRSPEVDEEIARLNLTPNWDKLTQRERLECIELQTLATVGEHTFTRWTVVNSNYRDLQTPRTERLMDAVLAYRGDVTRHVREKLSSQVTRITKAAPTPSSPETKAAVQAVLTDPTLEGQSLLSAIESAVDTSAVVISAADEEFASLLKGIADTFKAAPSGVYGSDEHLAHQKQLFTDLIEQQVERAKVALAVCHIQTGEPDQAIETLNHIIERGEYLQMGAAYDVRSQAWRLEGGVDQADQDARAAHALLLANPDVDLPDRIHGTDAF